MGVSRISRAMTNECWPDAITGATNYSEGAKTFWLHSDTPMVLFIISLKYQSSRGVSRSDESRIARKAWPIRINSTNKHVVEIWTQN